MPWSPLHVACAAGDVAAVEELLLLGDGAAAAAGGGMVRQETPLHVAIGHGHGRVVELLLARGASAEARDDGWQTAVSRALETADVRIVEPFLRHSPQNGAYILRAALRAPHAERYRGIVARAAELGYCFGDDDDPQTLFHAAGNGHVAALDALLRRGAQVNAACNKTTLLHWAASKGQAEAVELLLRYGADADALDLAGEVPLMAAVRNHDLAVARLLLAASPKVTPQVLTAAVLEGSPDVLDAVLAHPRVAVDRPDRYGRTALHLCLQHRRGAQVARLLLDSGADANACDAQGCTPLHLAASGDDVDVVADLLIRDAEVEARDARGRTPLCHAWHPDVARQLLERGADADAADHRGETPLHVACQRGSGAAVEVLLEHWADVDARAQDHRTPLQVAWERGCRDALRRHAAKLKAAGLRPDASVEDTDAFLDACAREVADMQRRGRVVYGVLSRSVAKTSLYVTTDALRAAVRFPLYSALVVSKARKALRRRALLQTGVAALCRLCRRRLPDLVAAEVMVYLGDEDLRNLANAAS